MAILATKSFDSHFGTGSTLESTSEHSEYSSEHSVDFDSHAHGGRFTAHSESVTSSSSEHADYDFTLGANYRYYGKLTFDIADVAPEPSTSRLDQILDGAIHSGRQLTGAEQAEALVQFQGLSPLQRSDPSLLLRMAAAGLPFVQRNFGRGGSSGVATGGLDEIQSSLDIAGLSPDPILGTAADVANAAISLARGQLLNAGLSIVSVVPLVGDAIGKGGKLATKVVEGATPAAASVAKTVRHHTITREILKELPEEVANNPLVRGRRGAPNRWRIPENLHKDIHRGARGGPYNQFFRDKLKIDPTPIVDEVLRWRDEAVKLFGLEEFRP